MFSLCRLVSFATIPPGTRVLGVGGRIVGYAFTLQLLAIVATIVIGGALLVFGRWLGD